MSKESSLHQALKIHYAGTKERTEQYIGDFTCDGVSPSGELIEVQTGSFGPLQEKIHTLTDRFPLRIIHPIIIRKKIELYGEDGKLLHIRKSPRKGTPWDLFSSLIYAPLLPLNPQVSIDLTMVDIVEQRIADGKGSWRRKGVSIQDRELAAWHGCLSLNCPADYRRFIPFADGEKFTAAQLARKTGIDAGLSRKTLYVLHKINVIQRIGKKGQAVLYQASAMSSSSRLFSAKRSVTARRSSK